MSERPRSRALLAVLTLVALLLITLDYRQGGDGGLEWVRRGALVVFAPVQEGFAQVVRPIGGLVSGVARVATLPSRNRALHAELDEAHAELGSVADLQRENAELRALLDMRDELELTTTAVRVIGQPPGERGNTLLLDAGGDDALEVGMAVLSPRGLVGKLTEVTPRYARVELLTSPTAHYTVRIAESGATGLLRGQGADPFRLELLDPEADAAVGDEVVTQTFQGSTIADGLPVGEIVERGEPDESPRYLAVSPLVDFRRLAVVQVVLDAPEPPDELDDDELLEPPDLPRPPPPQDDEDSQGLDDFDGPGDADEPDAQGVPDIQGEPGDSEEPGDLEEPGQPDAPAPGDADQPPGTEEAGDTDRSAASAGDSGLRE